MSVSGIGSNSSSIAAALLRRLQEAIATQNTASTGGASAANSVMPATSDARDTFRSDFSSLMSAVQSGDMAAAQKALTSLQNDGTGFAAQGSRGAGQDSPMGQSFSALAQAVQSGDTAGAQKALQTLQSAMRAHHGHHRHHAQSGTTVATPAAGQPSDPVAPPTTSVTDKDNDGDNR